MKRKTVSKEISEYMSKIGSKGGKKATHELSRKRSKAMLEARAAKYAKLPPGKKRRNKPKN